jgi:hypothetical protein
MHAQLALYAGQLHSGVVYAAAGPGGPTQAAAPRQAPEGPCGRRRPRDPQRARRPCPRGRDRRGPPRSTCGSARQLNRMRGSAAPRAARQGGKGGTPPRAPPRFGRPARARRQHLAGSRELRRRVATVRDAVDLGQEDSLTIARGLHRIPSSPGSKAGSGSANAFTIGRSEARPTLAWRSGHSVTERVEDDDSVRSRRPRLPARQDPARNGLRRAALEAAGGCFSRSRRRPGASAGAADWLGPVARAREDGARPARLEPFSGGRPRALPRLELGFAPFACTSKPTPIAAAFRTKRKSSGRLQGSWHGRARLALNPAARRRRAQGARGFGHQSRVLVRP